MEARKTWTPAVYFHPGEMLSEKLEEMGMSIEELAQMTAFPTYRLSDIAHGHEAVTDDMALALEKVSRIPARIWLKRQQGYDEYMHKKTADSYLDRAETFCEQSPSCICAEP